MSNFLFSKSIIFFGLSVATSHAVLVWNGGTDGSGNFQNGVNSWIGDGAIQDSVTSNPAQGATIATASGFSGTNNFLIIRGFDADGNASNYNTTFTDRTYVYSQTWNLTRDGGAAFAAGSEFIFSMDGAQYTNFSNVPALPVPEPSVALSLVGGLCVLLARRSRT